MKCSPSLFCIRPHTKIRALSANMDAEETAAAKDYAIERILNGEDHYHVLGIDPQPTGNLVDAARRCVILSKVSKAALTNCYRTLSRFVHTDKNIENPEATRAFQKLREAMSAVFCSVSELHTYIHTYIHMSYIHTHIQQTYIRK